MKQETKTHSFHIPVMGIGFTIDTPLKVSKFGISSVVSLVDDGLMERMREFYCKKTEKPFQAITSKMEDFRAKRITSYLNMMDAMVKESIEEMKNAFNEKAEEFDKYMDMLPDMSSVKQRFADFMESDHKIEDIQEWIKDNLITGEIDVNIMTKLDKENFKNNEELPQEYNDAHAALRGFANSNLSSSVVLSAGMNPRLYSYFEKFEDFFPNDLGEIKKKIILKVSDFRSAMIQGKIFAKKGLWISEYRIESGLNCGGHAFGSDGHLLGPVLEEFRQKKESLKESLMKIYERALEKKGLNSDVENEIKITAQGGVGTSEEHNFLLNHYDLDSVGWGSPFLLAEDVSSIDKETIDILCKADDNDLYLSGISPLGIPFRSIRTNTKDIEKIQNICAGTPGAVCIKKYGAISKEFTNYSICTASRQYQTLKIQELNERKDISEEEYQAEYNKIVDKSCICVGLSTASLLTNHLPTDMEGKGVSVCPGPNMAYFNRPETLVSIVNHIYGRQDIPLSERPNMFIKELQLYVDYLQDKVSDKFNEIDEKYFNTFRKNLDEGISYYRELFESAQNSFETKKEKMMQDLDKIELRLRKMNLTK